MRLDRMGVMPLDGIRVLDFSHVWAGPFCARLLGDFGAEVFKVESVTRYDPERGPAKVVPGVRGRIYPQNDPGERPYNRAGRFNAYNRNKLGLTLDLRTEDGLTLIRELVAISDVIVENFSVGVMKRLGLSYEDCANIRPDIVFISLPGFGSDGPEKGYVAYGLTQEAMSGLSGITGYPGEVPIDTGVFYGDPTGGLFGAAAVTTALWHRRMTGEGQHIDLSQREAFASILPELTFDYVMNSRVMQSTGNKHPEFAPQGCYRCKGEDAWVAITVHTDEQFSALRDVFEIPALLDAGKYGDMPSRKRNEASLDAIITGWTLRHEPYEAMHLLQARGVPAGAVLKNRQILEDPHFKARGYFEQVNGPFVGPHRQIGMPWKLPETPATVRLASPGLGEHNEYALGDLLGLSAADLERLAELNVIGTEPLSARQ